MEEAVDVPNLPAGTDHTAKICPACQEQMELFWDDNVDEWMLRNAVKIDGQVFTYGSMVFKRYRLCMQIVKISSYLVNKQP